MESTHQHQVRRQELVVIPLWEIGPSRPVGRERRRDRGALDRHIQAASGIAPAEAVRRRRTARPQRPEQLITLWREDGDAVDTEQLALVSVQPSPLADAAPSLSQELNQPPNTTSVQAAEMSEKSPGDVREPDLAAGEGRQHQLPPTRTVRQFFAAAASLVCVAPEAW